MVSQGDFNPSQWRGLLPRGLAAPPTAACVLMISPGRRRNAGPRGSPPERPGSARGALCQKVSRWLLRISHLEVVPGHPHVLPAGEPQAVDVHVRDAARVVPCHHLGVVRTGRPVGVLEEAAGDPHAAAHGEVRLRLPRRERGEHAAHGRARQGQAGPGRARRRQAAPQSRRSRLEPLLPRHACGGTFF